VLFAAPQPLADGSGDAVGYKCSVTSPIEIAPKDPAKPMRFAVSIEYGICREICVPAEAKLGLEIPPRTAALPEPIAAALKRVPTPAGQAQAGDPALGAVRAQTAGASPKIEATVSFPDGTAGADAFVEAPDGIYLPLPKKTADDGRGTLTFEIDLSNGIDLAELKGKPLLFTLVSAGRQAEAVWTMP
jgi:DsbC/DsbD-like thiol-disulfide interchange protein